MTAASVARMYLACLATIALLVSGCGQQASSTNSDSSTPGLTGADKRVPQVPPNDNTDALDVLTGGVKLESSGTGGPLLNKPKEKEPAESSSTTTEDTEMTDDSESSGESDDASASEAADETGEEDDSEGSDSKQDDAEGEQEEPEAPSLPPIAEATGEIGTNPGDNALEITGTDIDGAEFALSDYEGKVIMLDFWGHW